MPQTQEKPVITQISKQESATDILHFEKWLAILGERKATDLHLSVGNVPSLRVSGVISPLLEEEIITTERMDRIVDSFLSSKEKEFLLKEKQVVVSKTLKKSMRFKIHIFYSRGFLSVSLRYLSESFIKLGDLPHANVLNVLLDATQGLYIISGPFDSGRTSTLRSIVSEINQIRSRYIVMLESPIEFLIPSDKSVVVQREVGNDVLNFKDGLTALHDEDVDVVVIGEIDSKEVLYSALELASSGRLVIAVTTGNHVSAVLEMLRDISPEEHKARVLHSLGDVLIGISIQLLLPRVGGGRVLITSNMISTNPIQSLIREGKFDQIPNIMQTSGQEGMVTIDKALVDSVKSGIVSLQDAKEYAVDMNQFNVLVSH